MTSGASVPISMEFAVSWQMPGVGLKPPNTASSSAGTNAGNSQRDGALAYQPAPSALCERLCSRLISTLLILPWRTCGCSAVALGPRPPAVLEMLLRRPCRHVGDAAFAFRSEEAAGPAQQTKQRG